MSEDEIFPRKIIAAQQILPAWFVPRMMGDCYFFGLLTVTGHVIHIETIDRVYRDANGGIWLDAIMRENDFSELLESAIRKIGTSLFSPSPRCKVSINAAHIVAAFETQDS